MITQNELKKLLKYDYKTGIFIWIKGRRAGHIAGTHHSNGYIQIQILGKQYLAHRLVFLYMDGGFPENQADHINGKKSDNKWENLRRVIPTENHRNTKLHKNNKSGVSGVNLLGNKWQAMITGKLLGYYYDKFEAICVRKSAEIKSGYHKNHGRN